jgi:integrase
MGVHIWVNRGKLYLDIYHNGQRRRERLSPLELCGDKKTDKETMRLAGIIKAKKEQQIFAGGYGLIDPDGGKITLAAYAEGVAKERENRQLSQALEYLKEYHDGGIRLEGVDELWIERFQDWMVKSSGLAKSSAAAYCSSIRTILRRAVRDRMIPRNPAEGVKTVRAPEANRVHLDTEELQRLADTPIAGEVGAEVRRAFLFACFTGLRVSDIKSLTWGAIEHGQITKRQKKTENPVYIPIKDIAWGIINDGTIHHYADPVFPLLTGNSGNWYIKRWAKLAGVEKKIGWHTARHTFAVLSLEGGAEIYTVSKLLGHTDLKTTQIYARATDKMKKAAVDGLPRIEVK